MCMPVLRNISLRMARQLHLPNVGQVRTPPMPASLARNCSSKQRRFTTSAQQQGSHDPTTSTLEQHQGHAKTSILEQQPADAMTSTLERTASTVLVDLTHSVAGTGRGRFWIPAAEVATLMAENNLNEDELLQALITPASSLARPPISSFRVGAVGLGASGNVYVGVNLEFARLPLYNSVHAEQFLVVNAIHQGEREIRKLGISAAPCGHCRQFYSELSCADSIQIMFGSGLKHRFSLAQLLPERFRPSDLLEDPSTPLLLEQQNNSIELMPEAQQLIKDRAGDASFQEAARTALEFAIQSYAPYSRCPAGVSIITAAGDVYSGSYLESAAFNPSLPPLQTAIIDAVIDGMPAYTEVKEVVLVEVSGAPVRHEIATRIVLETIAPDARLTTLEAQLSDKS